MLQYHVITCHYNMSFYIVMLYNHIELHCYIHITITWNCIAIIQSHVISSHYEIILYYHMALHCYDRVREIRIWLSSIIHNKYHLITQHIFNHIVVRLFTLRL